jgi:Protein of unknown function (DUF2934)
MATKRVSPGTKTVKRKAAAAAPELTDSAVNAVLESTQSAAAVSAGIDADARRQLVAAEAYFLAEQRGFAAGHEIEDWVAAELAVDSQLKQMRRA